MLFLLRHLSRFPAYAFAALLLFSAPGPLAAKADEYGVDVQRGRSFKNPLKGIVSSNKTDNNGVSVNKRGFFRKPDFSTFTGASSTDAHGVTTQQRGIAAQLRGTGQTLVGGSTTNGDGVSVNRGGVLSGLDTGTVLGSTSTNADGVSTQKRGIVPTPQGLQNRVLGGKTTNTEGVSTQSNGILPDPSVSAFGATTTDSEGVTVDRGGLLDFDPIAMVTGGTTTDAEGVTTQKRGIVPSTQGLQNRVLGGQVTNSEGVTVREQGALGNAAATVRGEETTNAAGVKVDRDSGVPSNPVTNFFKNAVKRRGSSQTQRPGIPFSTTPVKGAGDVKNTVNGNN